MSSLLDSRDAIVAALQAAPELTGVTVYTHGGSFDLKELLTFSKKCPALVLALLRFDSDVEAGVIQADAIWGLVAFTKDVPGSANARDRTCIALAEAATKVILRAFPGTGATTRGRDAKARNLFTRDLDGKTNLAMWGVEFRQTLDLVEEIDTDDFTAMHMTWDLAPRDNDADLGDIPEAEDVIEPEQ